MHYGNSQFLAPFALQITQETYFNESRDIKVYIIEYTVNDSKLTVPSV